ncbi:MAG: DOPA 4,5-dioxygenase family protein [Gammaproteobacteria bacterium]|nr:DOPA 4,5-dioxygenase family protein [Gammaproteobacteria bacterium]MDH3412461.1 DOPA 4,5-dioxygenase family protein [Gammaproteobacteria bacterium]
MTQIQGFHAHVYYDAATIERARKLCQAAEKQFHLKMGRMHQRPVGPHPCWSCQLAFGPELFGQVIPWLALNRDGLVIFIHPETGDDLADHTRHAMWMGKVEKLDLSIFKDE